MSCRAGYRINVILDDHSYQVSRAEISKVACFVLKAEGFPDAEVNVVFTGDSAIRKLSREYFGKDSVTDVISFSFNDDLLGETYICLPQARRQARKIGVSIGMEVQRLLIHGLLHLVGYDHTRGERSKMFTKQENYLKAVSL